MTNLDSVLKSSNIILLTKAHIIKSMVFPVVMPRMWGLDHKECWALKNWCFRIVVLEKTLESLLDSEKIKPVDPKGDQPEYSLEGLMLSWISNTLATWWEESAHLKRPLCWKIEGKWRRVWQRIRFLNSIINSMETSLSKLQEIVKDRGAWDTAVQGLQRGGHDLGTEQQQTSLLWLNVSQTAYPPSFT